MPLESKATRRLAALGCACLIAVIAVATRTRADVPAVMSPPPRPPLPAEAALGIHRPWSPPAAVRDPAQRARRQAEIATILREAAAQASDAPPRIQFAEPPTVDSLPADPFRPPLPDTLTSGMSSYAVGDLNGDGLPDVAAVEYDDSLLVIRFGLGDGKYAPRNAYPLAAGAYALALGDVDGDGRLDIAVANLPPTPGHEFSVLRNLGDGVFGQRFDGNLSGLPVQVFTSDLGHDGRADLIFGLFNRSYAALVRTRADGTFGPEEHLDGLPYVDDYHQSSVAVGDLDGDHNPDVALLYADGDCYFGECQRIAIFYGRDDGSFDSPEAYNAYDSDVWYGAIGIRIQDVDADGRPDILVPAYADDYKRFPPAVIRNAGHRRWDAPAVSDVSRTPWFLMSGHTKHAAPADLMYSDGVEIMLLRNAGNGTFQSEEPVAPGTLAGWTDLNADGLDDLLAAAGDTIAVLLANGTGGFEPPATHFGLRFLALADFTGDRIPDLAAVLGNGDIGIVPGDGSGGFPTAQDWGALAGLSPPVLAADLDGDGRADFACLRSPPAPDTDDTLLVWWNEGATFSKPSTYAFGTDNFNGGEFHYPMDLRAGDFNGDHQVDVVVVKGNGQSGIGGLAAVLPNEGGRVFGPPSPQVYAGEDPLQATVSDFDGDGMDDVAIAAATTDWDGRFLAFGGTTDSSLEFMPGPSLYGGYAMQHWAFSVASADFNGDGRPDVAVGCGYAPYHGAAVLVVPNISPVSAPTPTLASLVSSTAEPNLVSLTWDLGGARTAAVERRTSSSDWASIASASADGTGRLRYDDRAVQAGSRYAYRLRFAGGATSAETWIDVPVALALAIQGARPNPTRGPLTVAFTLPSSARADLELLDVAGRRVRSLTLATPSAGAQTARLDAGDPLAAGLYFIRLTQGSSRVLARATVLR